MQVYQLTRDTTGKYRQIGTVGDEDNAARLDGFKGKPMRATWQPLEVQPHKDAKSKYDGEKFPASNYTQLGGMGMFDSRAVSALADILEANGEILPLIYKGKEDLQYIAYNTTTVIDALNETHSQVRRFSNGQIMVIDKYEFDAEKLEGATIFRIPQELRIYVTDEFARRVKEAGLTGFGLQPLWTYQPEHELVAA